MKILQLVGRILFGTVFLVNAVSFHFMQYESAVGYARSKGVPLPEVMVIVTGLMLLLGAVSIYLGYRPRIGLWLLVAFLIPTALIMHNFWAVGPEQRTTEMIQFLKDSALAGAALMMIVLATDRAWPYSVGGGGRSTVSAGETSAEPGPDPAA